jgi:hypothetical protein
MEWQMFSPSSLMENQQQVWRTRWQTRPSIVSKPWFWIGFLTWIPTCKQRLCQQTCPRMSRGSWPWRHFLILYRKVSSIDSVKIKSYRCCQNIPCHDSYIYIEKSIASTNIYSIKLTSIMWCKVWQLNLVPMTIPT